MRDSCLAFKYKLRELRKQKRRKRNRRIDPKLYRSVFLENTKTVS